MSDLSLSHEWLKRYLSFDKTPAQVAEAITSLGHEVEEVRTLGVAENPLLVVGEVLSRDKHPNADKLSVCKVDVGQGEPLQIVCGAQNYVVGDRVPVALVGCKLPGDFTIKQAKLRGVESCGMMCSSEELGLPKDVDGLMILTDRPAVGTPMHRVLHSDTIYELKITPNRADAMSVWGGGARLGGQVGGPTFARSGVFTASYWPHRVASVVKRSLGRGLYALPRVRDKRGEGSA